MEHITFGVYIYIRSNTVSVVVVVVVVVSAVAAAAAAVVTKIRLKNANSANASFRSHSGVTESTVLLGFSTYRNFCPHSEVSSGLRPLHHSE
jgi:hypothetical protein